MTLVRTISRRMDQSYVISGRGNEWKDQHLTHILQSHQQSLTSHRRLAKSTSAMLRSLPWRLPWCVGLSSSHVLLLLAGCRDRCRRA